MSDLPVLGLGELSEQLRFILDLGVAVAVALIGGAIAVRLRQPAVLGYLLAGILIGPATPGFVGDVDRIAELADLGVVLLLFALGVEFSIRGLIAVRRVAIPGATLQIVITLAVGTLLMVGLGFEVREAFVIGACLSLSSTLVVLKSLIDRGEMDSLHGKTAIGWSIVQDIATIVFIVALPPLAGGDVVGPFLLALAKAALFLAIAYVVGTRLLPRVFVFVARLGLERAVPAGRRRDGAPDRLRVERGVRAVAGARGVRRRRPRLRVGAVAPGGGRGHPVPGPVRGALLRVGRDARRPGGAGRGRRAGRPPGRRRGRRQGPPDRGAGPRLRAADAIGLAARGGHGPGRRVQLHPGRGRPRARRHRRAGLQPDPGHGRRVDPGQPHRAAARRPLGRADRGVDRCRAASGHRTRSCSRNRAGRPCPCRGPRPRSTPRRRSDVRRSSCSVPAGSAEVVTRAVRRRGFRVRRRRSRPGAPGRRRRRWAP